MEREQVGQLVKRAFTARNETSPKFAKRAGIALRTLESIISGERIPIARVQYKVEQALGWGEGTYEWLLRSDVSPDEVDPANPMRSVNPKPNAAVLAELREVPTMALMDELRRRISNLVQ